MPKPRILITAGPTREYLDPVRFLSNPSTGRMGLAIAQSALKRGWRVDLVMGPTALKIQPKPGMKVHVVVTADEMCLVTEKLYKGVSAFVATAAVSDYKPAKTSAHKIKKSGSSLIIKFVRNPDIAARLGKKKKKAVHVGFALETRDALKNAQTKLKKKNLDLIVLNSPDNFGNKKATACLIDAEGNQESLSGTKALLANKIIKFINERL